MYIDIHTHHKTIGNYFSIFNVMPEDESEQNEVYCSVGLHPWCIGADWMKKIEKQRALSHCETVLAIGECGLDRAIETAIDIQLQVFREQCLLAEELKKPTIVHCVRAYSDLLQFLKSKQFSVPFILHGFNGNAEQVKQLSKFNVYFSFGEALLKENKKLVECLKAIPLNRFFFETDESETTIESIYLRASELLGIPLVQLEDQVLKNFKHIFGDGLVK